MDSVEVCRCEEEENCIDSNLNTSTVLKYPSGYSTLSLKHAGEPFVKTVTIYSPEGPVLHDFTVLL